MLKVSIPTTSGEFRDALRDAIRYIGRQLIRLAKEQKKSPRDDNEDDPTERA